METAKRILITIVICLVAIELLLRLSGVFKTSSEKSGMGYVSSYGEVHPTWYNNHKPYDTLVPPATDFHYQFCTNKLGIRDKDYSEDKPDSVFRILITGNSYVEGVGAPYDSTWPRLIEKELLSRNMRVEVIDAGIASNDIMYDYVFYRDKLRSLHANLVIATMNNSDYIYYAFRGGMERFNKDGTVHYLPIPRYDFLYHYSHLFRAILAIYQPLEGAYLSKNTYSAVANRATTDFAQVIKTFSDTVTKDGSGFVLIVYPKSNDIGLSSFFARNSTNNFNNLASLLSKDNISNFNIITPMKNALGSQRKENFTYQHDWHFKPSGYLIMAKLTTDSLLALPLIYQNINSK